MSEAGKKITYQRPMLYDINSEASAVFGATCIQGSNASDACDSGGNAAGGWGCYAGSVADRYCWCGNTPGLGFSWRCQVGR